MSYLEFVGTMLCFAGLVLGGVKSMLNGMEDRTAKEVEDVWDRVNNHYHEIQCGNKDCTALHTGNVIIPRGGK